MSMFRWPLALSPWRRRDPVVAPPRPRLVASGGVTMTDALDTEPNAALLSPELPDVSPQFFAWLMAQAQTPAVQTAGVEPSDGSLPPQSMSTLAEIDKIIASDPQRNALLPRAPQVLPQLMSAVRGDNYAAADIAARIGKDAVLTAEVIRAANGAHRSGREPVVELEAAVLSIGADNLRRVIAKSVLRPIFNVRGASLSALAAPQIWVNAEFKARLCAALAAADKLDALDGYLAGMLHDTGWTALLRALDGLGSTAADLPMLLAPTLARSLAERRDVLFGKMLRPWQLSDALVSLADELQTSGLAQTASPLGVALRRAHLLASLHALDCDRRLPGGMDDTLCRLPPAVQACYLAVTRSP